MQWITTLWQNFPSEVQSIIKWLFDKHLTETIIITGVLIPFFLKMFKSVGRWKSGRDLRKKLPDYTPQQIKKGLRYYIWPDCQSIDPCSRDEIKDIIAVSNKLAFTLDVSFKKDGEFKHYILLADSGMGKTSFLLNYFARHMRKLRKPYNLEMIPLNVPGLKERLDRITDKNKTILLLDAFDEDTEAIKDHRKRLKQIINCTRDFYRVLITSRTQFFPRDEEIPEMTGIVKIGPRDLGEGGQYVFNKIYLSPFSEEQVSQYLKKCIPFWQRNKRRIAAAIVKKIPNLAVRPMLLAYVDDLIASDRSFTNAFQIYEVMVEKWIEREKGFIQDKEALRTFSNKLAVDLFLNRKKRGGEMIRYEELKPLAEKYGINLETWQLAGRSLLNRDALGNYKFAHRSILEFLLAKYIIELGAKAREYRVFRERTEQVRSFMIEGYGRIDWRCPFYFVRFNGGVFQFENETEMNLQPFEMAIYPVTNIEYEEFEPRHKEKRNKYSNQDNQPVIYVSWDDAQKYCEWLSKKTGMIYRLATEVEWEYAASDGGRREYPWGNEYPTRHHANYRSFKIGATTPVGMYEKGKTPEGLYDMVGNVWEWCRDWKKGNCVLCGGSFDYVSVFLRCSLRIRDVSGGRDFNIGFRVVRVLRS